MIGPILIIPPAAQRALLDYQLHGNRVHWWFVMHIRIVNGINECATKWRGWRSTTWGRKSDGQAEL
jgi:hypothetical protein